MKTKTILTKKQLTSYLSSVNKNGDFGDKFFSCVKLKENTGVKLISKFDVKTN